MTIRSLHRLWLACAVVVVTGLVHAGLAMPEAWEGVRAAQAKLGSTGLWDYVRIATILVPGLGAILLWERAQRRKAEVVASADTTTMNTETEDRRTERVAA